MPSPLQHPGNTPSATPVLQDRYGRRIDYLRLSLTDRCDLRCSYCRPKHFDGYAEPSNWLTFDEIERVVATFARMGVAHVRLTGGEPLLRRNIVDLVARLSPLPGIRDLSLSTNATQLTRFAEPLKQAGLARINVSLDSLDRTCVEQVSGRDSLQSIMDGIMAGKAAGLTPVKINMVAMRGINEHEIANMAAFCLENGFILRLIEAMPIGENGRNTAYLPCSRQDQPKSAAGRPATGKPVTEVVASASLPRYPSTSAPAAIACVYRSKGRFTCAWDRKSALSYARCCVRASATPDWKRQSVRRLI